MFAEKGMRVVNDIYFIMRVNLCWFLFVIEGGVILGLIPATITLFSCIRNRMKNDFQGVFTVSLRLHTGRISKLASRSRWDLQRLLRCLYLIRQC